jgi:hypothetical protein
MLRISVSLYHYFSDSPGMYSDNNEGNTYFQNVTKKLSKETTPQPKNHNCHSSEILKSHFKVKESHYRPGLWFKDVEAPRFQNNRHMKVARLSALSTGRFYPQEIFLVLISVRGRVDPRAIVLPDGLCQWKIPLTPSGIEPATSRLLAQCLEQLRHQVPHSHLKVSAGTAPDPARGWRVDCTASRPLLGPKQPFSQMGTADLAAGIKWPKLTTNVHTVPWLTL